MNVLENNYKGKYYNYFYSFLGGLETLLSELNPLPALLNIHQHDNAYCFEKIILNENRYL